MELVSISVVMEPTSIFLYGIVVGILCLLGAQALGRVMNRWATNKQRKYLEKIKAETRAIIVRYEMRKAIQQLEDYANRED